MNIFIIFLMTILTAGYYFMDSPNIYIGRESRSEMIENAELKSVVSCMMRAHNEAVSDTSTDMPCIEKYQIAKQKFCSDEKRIIPDCTTPTANKNVSNYIVTTTDIVTENGAGKILEILDRDYPFSANFGIIIANNDGAPTILGTGASAYKIPKVIADAAKLANGQLVYMTMSSIRGKKSPAVQNQMDKIKCGSGEILVFTQNRWNCIQKIDVPTCSGDYVWDSSTSSCIPDNSKRPLCQSNTTAVLVNDVWECIAPEPARVCPKGFTAQMNYESLEWECIENNPSQPANEQTKCRKVYDKLYGGGDIALHGNLISCNDCEKMIVHDDCTAECVPDVSAISKQSCYSGQCQNFYFGFPDDHYIADAKKNLPALNSATIPTGAPYSRNRRFNCINCPLGVNTVASTPPYTIICN